MKPKFNRTSRLFLALSALTCALSAPVAFAATETFNTAGTFNWVCPPGVSSVQVECWGGGGAGGAATKVINTGGNTSQNGGGGGGGAYAVRFSVPVTPGASYSIVIPPAAVSVAATSTTQVFSNGSAVTFVGDSSVTVTAAGGAGGGSIWRDTNVTAGGAGGAGGSVGASIGDLIFSGGAGSAGNTGATNVSGSGGGGGGNSNPGGAGFTSTTTPYVGAGAGGLIGGGNGGVGRTGSPPTSGNTNKGVGTPGSTPGGGGGGAKNQAITSFLGGAGGLGQISITYSTTPALAKENNSLDLNLATSWVGGMTVPGATDIAGWDSTVLGANTTLLGADTTWAGLKITNPGGLVTINPGNTLTLGAAPVDIDMNAATQDLTLNNDLVLGSANVWNVAAARTLTLGGAISGSAPIIKLGDGSATLAGAVAYTGSTNVAGGTLTISGASTATGTTTVTAGKLNVTGSTNQGTGTDVLVANAATGNAVLNIQGPMTARYLSVGGVTGASGAVNISTGGSFTGSTTDIELGFTFGAGTATGGYGYLGMTDGTVTTRRFQFGGQNVAAQNGVGVGLISGGIVNADSFVILARYGTSPGTIGSLTVATGGTLNHTSLTAGQNFGLGWQGAGRAELNLTGGTITSATGRTLGYGAGGALWTGTGIVNLDAGTLTTTAITTAGTGATSYLNFNGGTLKAVSTQSAFLPALTGVYVNGPFGAFTGGAVIDSNAAAITVGAALIAPTGDGVATIPVTSGGSGYIGAPAVSIADGGVGFGATAIANMADDGTGNGTLTIASITITNPGNNYTAPVASLVGGGNGVTAATLGALTTALNSSGGLTKSGLGTLTLNGANTFTGATLVSNGGLIVNNALASSAVSLASGTTLGGTGTLAGTVTVDTGTAQITGGDGTSGTLSTQNLTFSGTGVINVGALGNYSTNPAIDTLGALTLNGGAGAVTLNLNPAPVASGTYRLVRAASGIADASGFTLGTTPAPVGRQAAGTLQYDGGTSTVTYTTGGTYPIWSGAQSSEWSTNVISPSKNWQLADLSGGTDFIAGDEVLFDNSAPLKTVDISNGNVLPSVVSFANTAGNDYILQGTNGIAGSAVLLKTGNGKLTVTNTNSHIGGTTISSGILAFASGSLGASGPITVNGGTLQWDGANTQDISSRLTLFNSTTATLDTNGNDVILASAFGGGTSGGLAKAGNGILTLSAANTFTGITNINVGTLKIGNATSLGTQTGATDRTIIASGATLDLGGVGLGANNEFVTVSGSGVGGNGAITSSGVIPTPFIGVRFLTLAGDTTLGFTNRWDVGNNTTGGTLTGGGFTLNISGSGVGQASLNGLGETDLGDINVNLGATAATNILFLQGSTTLGRPANTVTIIGGSTLDVFTNSTLTSVDKKFDLTNGVLRISKVGAMSLPGTIELTGAGTITANGATVAITSSNEISGGGSFTKDGAGTLALTGTNVFTGTATVSAGGLVVGANDALGTTAGNTTVAPSAGLGLSGSINYSTAETIIGSGVGTSSAVGVFAVSQRGFVQSVSGNNTFAGAIQINATGSSRIGTQDGASLTLTGPVTMSGATGVTVLFRVGNTDGDFVTLTNSGNSWDTQTQIFTGNAGTGAGVRLGVTNALPTAASLVGFGGSGTGTTLDLASFSQEVAGLSTTGAGPNLRITNSVASSTSVLTLTNAANLNSGAGVVIADGAGVIGLVKAGTFSQTLAAANSFSGPTTVNAGTLTLGNALALGTSSATVTGGSLDLGGQTIANVVSVGTAGTLTGSGSITGAATLEGNVTPGGSSSGLITLASATVTSTAAFTLQLPATGTRGTSYDAITVSGALALDGTVTVDITGLTPTVGQTFDLIDSTGPIDVTNFAVATDLILPALGGSLAWDTSAFASTGVVSIVNGDPFNAWALSKGLTGAPGFENGKAADPDNDGKDNLYEFAFDGDPLSGANDGKVVGKIATVGGNQVLTLTLPVRNGAIFSASSGDQLSALIDALYYRIEGDETLVPFADTITEVTTGEQTTIQLGLPPLSSGWTYRTFRAPGTVPTVPKAFLRAKATETP
jgi:fibronectin-binding autotransporter adhesin